MPIRIASVAAPALAISDFTPAALQARERFGQVLAINGLVAAIRLVPVLALTFAGALTLTSALETFLLASVVATCLTVVVVVRACAGPVSHAPDTVRELLVFSR